jgi:hypothetical protein
MKKGVLLILLISAVSVHAQSLKEALYGGKLKLDSGSVIRKTDDLSTKIDTVVRKQPVAPEKAKVATGARDSLIAGLVQSDPTTTVVSAAGKENAVVSKDNNKIWKDFIDELTTSLRTDVLPSKKIKDGSYSVLIDYEIGVDGQITVNKVSSSPESSFLEQQVKDRITLTAPQMTPLLGVNGKPRKAPKKQILTIAK